MSLLKVNQVTDLAGDTPDGVGRILQVVQVAKTDVFTTASTSFTAITGLSATITPSSTSSKILVLGDVKSGPDNNTPTTITTLRMLRGATEIYIGDAAGSRTRANGIYLGDGRGVFGWNPTFLDAPASTSALTYSFEMKTGGGTTGINRAGSDADAAASARVASSITLMEVAG